MGLLDDAIKEHLELKRRRGADAGEITRLESEALGPVPRSAEGVPDLPDTFQAPQDKPPAVDEADAPQAGAAPPASADGPPLAPPPASGYEPPLAPPPASGYEPADAPPLAPPPVSPAPPPTASTAAYEPPPAYESPPPPVQEAWMADDPPEPDTEREGHTETETEAESGGLFSRLRGGRRHKRDRDPEPEREREREREREPYGPDGYEPPPLPLQPLAPTPPAGRHEPDIVPADDEPDVEDLLEETPEFLEETPEHDRLWFEQRPPRDFNFDD